MGGEAQPAATAPFPAGDGSSSRSVRPRWRRWPTPAMLCYVTRPDAVVMEVEVEAKANGEDCLNQVRGVPSEAGGGLPYFPPYFLPLFFPLPSMLDAGVAASLSPPLSGPATVIAFLLHLCGKGGLPGDGGGGWVMGGGSGGLGLAAAAPHLNPHPEVGGEAREDPSGRGEAARAGPAVAEAAVQVRRGCGKSPAPLPRLCVAPG